MNGREIPDSECEWRQVKLAFKAMSDAGQFRAIVPLFVDRKSGELVASVLVPPGIAATRRLAVDPRVA